MKNSITLLGDIHGKYKRMHEVIREKDKHEYIVALGDVGFSFETLDNVDPKKFVIVGGNHDNYSKIVNIPHYLGDYGCVNNFNGIDFFFFRGAYSIDRQYRTIGIDWWEDEQVKIEDFMKARELYRQIKPDVVLTHDCPQSLYSYLLPPGTKIYENITSWALEELFNIHQPKFWRFGHFHQSWRKVVNGTDFRCLNELETEILTKGDVYGY
jgi:Icc-related predicted phosphoesterase